MANLKKSEIDSLLDQVEAELTAALKEEHEKLAKAHPGEETTSEVDSDTSATDPKEPEASTSPPPGDGDTSAPAPDASASVSPEASGPADASAPPADGSAPADPAADPSNDPQALQDEYSKLGAADPEELKNHYLACKAALFALMGAGADASAAAPAAPGAPPAGPASPPPMAPPIASPSPDAPPAMKSEKSAGGMPTTTEAANGGQGMMKSENDKIKGLTEKLAKQEEAMASLLTVVTTMVETPVRKGITSIEYLAKTEDEKSGKDSDLSKLPKAEVKARLRQAAEKPLRKSDRDLINAFDLGRVGVEKIAHLIK